MGEKEKFELVRSPSASHAGCLLGGEDRWQVIWKEKHLSPGVGQLSLPGSPAHSPVRLRGGSDALCPRPSQSDRGPWGRGLGTRWPPSARSPGVRAQRPRSRALRSRRTWCERGKGLGRGPEAGRGCRAGGGAGPWPMKVGRGRHLELRPGGGVPGGG